jgi:hypothetical protein
MPIFARPPAHPRVKVVQSFEELVTTRFSGDINALCWERTLEGDFQEVVAGLGQGEGICPLADDRLRSLSLSTAGLRAVEVLMEDQRLLREHGLAPVLDCIYGYPRDEESEIVATDVFSFHADSAPVEAGTYLCTYHGLASEGVANEQAVRRIDIPETRAALLEEFGGEEGADFEEYLSACCYDLHYALLPGARPYGFGLGNLWRVAVQYPSSPVLPCIHRAPATGPADSPRLLLIS